jgi:penicillin-binding protein 1C
VKRLKAALAVLLVPLAGALALVVAAACTPLPEELRHTGSGGSVVVVDRDGHLLREVRSSDGVRARWLHREDVSPMALEAVLAAEDARFRSHPGVDVLSVVRATFGAVTHRRVVSGASTITMQLARLVRPHPRTLRGKLGEMALALRIEWSLSKDEILEQYVNRVGFGPNLRGIDAASEAYFDKSPRSLSLAEGALLAGLPRGPSLYEVNRHAERAKRRRDRVLDRMRAQGRIGDEELARAKAEPVVVQRRAPAFRAPHLVAGLVSGTLAQMQGGLAAAMVGAQQVERLDTTIDAGLQRVAEAETTAALAELSSKGVTAASVVVVDNATGDVLAYVGSPDFWDQEHGGQNDGARARRQPGSALKPFLYELAMERLGFDPSTILPDVELHLPTGAGTDYAPRDYDGRFRGPVRLREALASSLNVPAVWTADRLGTGEFLDRLHELGFASLTETADTYGPGLALGDGEVTLLELARAYATLARGGLDEPLRFVSRVVSAGGASIAFAPATQRRLLPKQFASLVTDVLKDHTARSGAFGERSVLDFPYDVAAKTGTSKGFRDNWAAGFTRAVTVAVWVGNFDGTPMTNVSGITGAGPLFHAVLEAAMQSRVPEPLPVTAAGDGTSRPQLEEGLERVEVCALSGAVAGPRCRHRVAEWRPVGGDRSECTMHVRVLVDRRNGLRAGPGCGAADVEEKEFERFPPELLEWAEATERPVEPLVWSPFCPGDGRSPASPEPGRNRNDAPFDSPVSTDGIVRIVYPLPDAHFVIDPDRPRDAQRLDVQVVAPASARETTLLVDGRPVPQASSPGAPSWKLDPGEHELVAAVDGVRSAPVRVYVRGGG